MKGSSSKLQAVQVQTAEMLYLALKSLIGLIFLVTPQPKDLLVFCHPRLVIWLLTALSSKTCVCQRITLVDFLSQGR